MQEISEITVTNQQLFNALKQKTTVCSLPLPIEVIELQLQENVKVLTQQLNDLQKKLNEANEENVRTYNASQPAVIAYYLYSIGCIEENT